MIRKTTLALAATLGLLCSAAQAGTLTYYFSQNGYYNGLATLTDKKDFATATFEDVAGGVRLTMTALPGLDKDFYVNDWAFNVGSGTLGAVRFSSGVQITGSGSTGVTWGNNAIDNFGGAKGGAFDLKFSFNTANPGELQSPDFSTWMLTGAGLTSASFDAADNKGLFAAVHVQGGTASSFYAAAKSPTVLVEVSDPAPKQFAGSLPPAGSVPVPGTLALFGLGIGAVALARRRA